MIKIGDTSLKTARPADLAEQVHALTGCSIAEVSGHLGGRPMPGTIAKLLRPFLQPDAPDAATLGPLIADADPIEIAAKVKALYDAAEEKA